MHLDAVGQELGIAVSLEVGTRKEPRYRYESTNRYYRGRVLALLHENASAGGEEIDLRDLGCRVREDFTDEDVPWPYGVVESLKKDGLAAVRRGARCSWFRGWGDVLQVALGRLRHTRLDRLFER